MTCDNASESSLAATEATDEQLLAVTVGRLELLNSSVQLAPYDPEWLMTFLRYANLVRAALSERALQLEHVGSTSIPGLAAKPIIDMVLAVPDSSDEAAYVPALEAQGFALRIREPKWFEHRLLKASNAGGNLHVFTFGCEEIIRMLAFRDWLRGCKEDRQRYEDEKRKLAARTWKHIQNYADAKSGIIQDILTRALPSSADPCLAVAQDAASGSKAS